MYKNLLKNDIKNNFFQSMSICFFIFLSTVFLATAGQLSSILSNSIQHLFEKAETPHLLQMHKGLIDKERMISFVESHPEIMDFQILGFVNIENSKLAFNNNSLKDSIYDNGFSTQSPKFDFLLDTNGNRIKVKKGEVYVPIFYMSNGLAKEGDFFYIGKKSLKVKGFVRDSQMNSSLSVSKRFIVSSEDYKWVKSIGEMEYLIEFKLNDLSKSSEIERAYNNLNLEANGPPFMTYALFSIVNAFSDGISISVMAFISLLIICISLLCIRFALLSKLEEDYKEYAVLKAIGIPFKTVKRLFLAKYLFIVGSSCILGFLSSYILIIPFLDNIKIFFGEPLLGITPTITAMFLSLMIFFTLFFYMSRLANQLKKIEMSPMKINEKDKIYSMKAFPEKFFLAVSDLSSRKKIYRTMVTVFILAIFVLTVPMSIYSTVSDKNFVNYLGIGSYDIRADISEIEGNEEKIKKMIQELKNDSEIKKMEVYHSKRVDVLTDSGDIQKLWVDFGNHESFSIKYIEGKIPKGEDEISLSKLKADDLSKSTGDTITLLLGGKEKKLRISGIFSDISNGGKTAKANFFPKDIKTIWMVVPLKLNNELSAQKIIKKYLLKYPFVKFSDVDNYVTQIFGNIISTILNITWASFGISIFLVFLINTLFIRLIYLKDQGDNALLKALGFSNKYIYMLYFIKSGLLLVLGIIIGYFLALTLGDYLASGILSLIGVSGVKFIHNSLFLYIPVPITMLFSTLTATYLGVRKLGKINISQILKEEA